MKQWRLGWLSDWSLWSLLVLGIWGTLSCSKEPAPVADATSPAAEAVPAASDLHVVYEAEALTPIVPPMVVKTEEGTANGKCVRVPAGQPKDVKPKGEMSFKVTLDSSATAHLWFRTHWSGSCANSLSLLIPGRPEFILGEDGTYGTWHWVRGPAVPLDAGTHELRIKQREEDTGIDQILVTSDKHYVPMGIED